MVNPGHRSKGCQKCRQSKVKCDEQHPACGRCTRTGYPCPGYVNVEEDFRSMNSQTELIVQHRVLERKRIRNTTHSSSEHSHERSMVSQRSSNSPSSLSPDWTEQSVSIFMANYVEHADHLHSTWGHLEYIVDMYGKPSARALSEAVRAASYAYLANISSIQQFNQMANMSYGRTLLDLSAAMNDKARATDDETIAATNVLAVYESIAGTRPFWETFHGHSRGQSTLLRLRNLAPSESRWAKSLFAVTNRSLILRDMASFSRPTLGLTDWPPSTYPSALAEISARLSVRAADIRGRVENLISEDCPIRGENWRTGMQAVASDAVELGQDFSNCPRYVPKEWHPRTLAQQLSLASSLRQGPEDIGLCASAEDLNSYPSQIKVCPTPNIATLWNFIGLARLHLLRALLRLGQCKDFPAENCQSCIPQPEVLQDDMQTTVEEISASVPFVSVVIAFAIVSSRRNDSQRDSIFGH